MVDMRNIAEVKTKKHIKDFLQVPRFIYQNNPYWISHLDNDIEAVFDASKNKFFEFGIATRWVLYDENSRPIGRVAAFINRQLAFTYQKPTGGMGFFECVNDQQSANELFDTMKQWLQQHGMLAVDGPINFGERDRYWGLLVQGFETPPPYLLNYNPPYYRELFEAYGFQNFFDQFVYRLNKNVELHPVFRRSYERLMHDPGYRFATLKLDELDKYAMDFMTIFNEAWQDVQKHFKTISKEQALAIFRSMKSIIDPDLVIFAYHHERPIAIFVGIPEINQLLRYVNGKLNLWGKLKFLYYRFRGKCNMAYGIVFGIVPDFRNKGVESGLINAIQKSMQAKDKYQDLYLAWIGDYNPKMIRIVETLTRDKVFVLTTYRLMFNSKDAFERHYVIE
jgi:hypothetical protein